MGVADASAQEGLLEGDCMGNEKNDFMVSMRMRGKFFMDGRCCMELGESGFISFVAILFYSATSANFSVNLLIDRGSGH